MCSRSGRAGGMQYPDASDVFRLLPMRLKRPVEKR